MAGPSNHHIVEPSGAGCENRSCESRDRSESATETCYDEDDAPEPWQAITDPNAMKPRECRIADD